MHIYKKIKLSLWIKLHQGNTSGIEELSQTLFEWNIYFNMLSIYIYIGYEDEDNLSCRDRVRYTGEHRYICL